MMTEGSFFEFFHSNGEVTHHVLVDTHIALHFVEGVSRRIEVHQDVMSLTILF